MDSVIMRIEENLDEGTAKGLARAITRLLPDGTLQPGDRLPAIRTIATELCVSPTTVNAAWALLLRWGTITTDGRRGTRIAPQHPSGSKRYQRALHHPQDFAIDLANGIPDPELLPDLTKALGNLRSTTIPGGYLETPALPELVEQLREDWPYPAESFTVVDGAMDATELAFRTLVRHGDRVVIENPTFPPVPDLLETLGAEVVSVPMDSEGMDPLALAEALKLPARLVFLQPRGHNPTGISMTRRRARAIGAVIKRAQVTVFEDDAAGCAALSPPISLGEFVPELVIHARSFSKSHGVDLRLAAVSGTWEMIQRLEAQRQFGQGWTSRILQRILSNFLADPEASGRVEAARVEYARRGNQLRAVLQANGVHVEGADGINVWVPVADETTALMRLASKGIAAAGGSPFQRHDADPHIRVSIGMLRDDIENVGELVAAAARFGRWGSHVQH